MPEQDILAYEKGLALLKEGKSLEALEQLRFAAENGVDRAMEHFALATASFQCKRYEEASLEYKRFLEMGGAAIAHNEHASQSLKRIENILSDSSNNHKSSLPISKDNTTKTGKMAKRYNEALAYYRAGGYEPALERFLALSKDLGETAELMSATASALQKLGREAQALELLERASKREEASSQVFLSLGELYFSLACNKALASFNRAISLSEDLPLPWFNRASLWFAMGKYEEAIADWKKVLELDPGDGQAKKNIVLAKSLS